MVALMEGLARQLAPESLFSVVAPMFNERANVEAFVEEVRAALLGLDLPCPFEIVIVDDGSWDGTGEALDAQAQQYPGELRVIHLARNFGHASAVGAGLDHARGQVVVLMDADLQDNPAAFGAFLEQWMRGYDVVYAQRASRQESAPMRVLFWMFYRVFTWIVNLNAPLDAGNFALMDRRVVKQLTAFSERNRYLPGLRAWIGFRQTGVLIPRRARYDQRGRVGLRGLWTLAMNAVFSFSYVPLFIFRIAGMLSVLLSLFVILFALYHKFFTGLAVTAWASQLVATSFLGGVNLLGIGLLGEYIARIYDEVKARPLYIVDRIIEDGIAKGR